ncbi:transcription elongation factor, mitochondrial [Brachionichthys hirsutus]|uniref:transcription elongation factor, mitochondrial n=1 Tax=Brachionichthys hirsutus TaxID=412623 RepID=UPI0036043961
MWFTRRFLSSVVKRSCYGGPSGLFRRPQLLSMPELEPQYLQCTCCWRSRVPVVGFETLYPDLTSSASAHCSRDNRPLDAYYTSDQRDTILNLLNTAAPSVLAGVKLLRGRKSLNIVAYRDRHGPFTTLESLVNVPMVKHKSAVTVFNSILNPVQRPSKGTIPLGRFISPEVGLSRLEGSSSIVSIVCGINGIAWIHVDRGMAVLDWQQADCPNFLRDKYEASAYLTDVATVVSLLPSADLYVIEKSAVSLHNKDLFSVVAHMRTVEAMLFALLEPRNSLPESDIPPRVLNMSRVAVGRHFGLMVGFSRTSGAQTVQRLMTESVTHKSPRITFPPNLLVKYRHSFQLGSGTGEELCAALLQAVAFFELLSSASG